MKKIHKDDCHGNYDVEFNIEQEQMHLIWEIMISCFKIADTANEKIKEEFHDAFSLEFLLRDTYRK